MSRITSAIIDTMPALVRSAISKRLKKLFRLAAFSVAFVFSAFLAHELVTIPQRFSDFQQLLVIAGITLAVSRAFLAFVEILDLKPSSSWRDWVYYAPVLIWILFWGRFNFINFFYYDEFGRFSEIYAAKGFSLSSLFSPVNDHFLPVLKIYWFLNYSCFRGDYFGVALTGAAFAIGIIIGIQILLKQLIGKASILIPLVATCLLAATVHSPKVILWKGAGDGLMLSFMFLILTIIAVIRHIDGDIAVNSAMNPHVLVLSIVTVYSSSQITLLPAFLVPIGIWVFSAFGSNSKERHYYKYIFVQSVLITITYWLLRRYLADIQLPPGRVFDPMKYFGAIRGALTLYFSSTILAASFVLSCIISGAAFSYQFLSRRQIRLSRLSVFWGLGISMLVVGVSQLVAARNMGYANSADMEGYHLFLANWGIGISWIAILIFCTGRLKTVVLQSRYRWVNMVVTCAMLAASANYVYSQYGMLPASWPGIDAFDDAGIPEGITRFTVIAKRREFMNDLQKMITDHEKSESAGMPLPDLPLTESPLFIELAMWPVNLNKNPSYSSNWIALSRLSHLRLLLNGDKDDYTAKCFRAYSTDDCAKLTGLINKEYFIRFFNKYWPGYDWVKCCGNRY